MSQNIKEKILEVLDEHSRQMYLLTEENDGEFGTLTDIGNRGIEAILNLLREELPKEPYCKYMNEVTNQAYLEGFEDYRSEMLKILEGK